MPSQLAIRTAVCGPGVHRGIGLRNRLLQCRFPPSPATPTSRRRQIQRILGSRRMEFTTASPASIPTSNPRAELGELLLELRKLAPNHVNPSRLELALQSLQQTAGKEAIRVVVLAHGVGLKHRSKAKAVLGALLADPLKEEDEWERQLASHDPGIPLVVRVGPKADAQLVEISRSNLLPELEVTSPRFNDCNLEILFMEAPVPVATENGSYSLQPAQNDLLVPKVDIPATESGHFTPALAPVHKVLVVADGVMGAAAVAPLQEALNLSDEIFMAAVDLPGYTKVDGEELSFVPINVMQATKGLELLRESLNNAMEYEHHWSPSNMSALIDWLGHGIQAEAGEMKPIVRALVASLLQNTLRSLAEEERRQLSPAPSAKVAGAGQQTLLAWLASWAENAHTELRDGLDLAFAGSRWRKLGWWKLFWRVDDVVLLTNEMLSHRFLPDAERELIYLAGRIQGSGQGATYSATVTYSQPASTTPPGRVHTLDNTTPKEDLGPEPPAATLKTVAEWPVHLSFTRRYLQQETVPALQALAQKLVVQAMGTSAMATSLAALIYVSSFTAGVYEAGAVTALGIVWSLQRMQKKWETARGFWESEVREEGRKAVRAVEKSVADAIRGQSYSQVDGVGSTRKDLEIARELVAKAEDALARVK